MRIDVLDDCILHETDTFHLCAEQVPVNEKTTNIIFVPFAQTGNGSELPFILKEYIPFVKQYINIFEVLSSTTKEKFVAHVNIIGSSTATNCWEGST